MALLPTSPLLSFPQWCPVKYMVPQSFSDPILQTDNKSPKRLQLHKFVEKLDGKVKTQGLRPLLSWPCPWHCLLDTHWRVSSSKRQQHVMGVVWSAGVSTNKSHGSRCAVISDVLLLSLFLGKSQQFHLGQRCSLVSEARDLCWKRKEGVRARKGRSQDVRISRSSGYHNESAGIRHLKIIDSGFVKAPEHYWGLQHECEQTQERVGWR